MSFIERASPAFVGTVAALSLALVFGVPYLEHRFDALEAKLTELSAQNSSKLEAAEFRERQDAMVLTLARQQANLDNFIGQSSDYRNIILGNVLVSELIKNKLDMEFRVTRFDQQYYMFVDETALSQIDEYLSDFKDRLDMFNVKLIVETP